jgi:hypothetical protein
MIQSFLTRSSGGTFFVHAARMKAERDIAIG